MNLPSLADGRAFEREATEEGFESTPDGEPTSVKLRLQAALQPDYEALKAQVPAFVATPFSDHLYRPVEKTALGFKRIAGRDGSVVAKVETLPTLQDYPVAVAAAAAVGGLSCSS